MRLINAFELKQRILEERDKIPLTLPGAVYEFGIEKPNHYGNAMRGGIRKALRCMEQCYNYTLADTVNQTQHWIPVSERLPEEHESIFKKFYGTNKWTSAMFQTISDNVLAVVSHKDGSKTVKIMCTLDGEWRIADGRPWNITHWMPLPEAPKEDNK